MDHSQWVVSKCLQVNFQGEVTSERIGGLKLKSQVIPILNHLISFPSHCTFHRLQRICIERVVWSSSDEVQLLIAGHWNDLRRDDRLIPRAWTSRRWNRRTLQNTWSLTLELLTHLWWGGSQRRRTLKLKCQGGKKMWMLMWMLMWADLYKCTMYMLKSQFWPSQVPRSICQSVNQWCIGCNGQVSWGTWLILGKFEREITLISLTAE